MYKRVFLTLAVSIVLSFSAFGQTPMTLESPVEWDDGRIGVIILPGQSIAFRGQELRLETFRTHVSIVPLPRNLRSFEGREWIVMVIGQILPGSRCGSDDWTEVYLGQLSNKMHSGPCSYYGLRFEVLDSFEEQYQFLTRHLVKPKPQLLE